MDLSAARDLKQLIRREARTGDAASFATGITRKASSYGVVILLRAEQDRRFLDRPSLRRIIGRERKAIDIEITGIVHVAAGAPSVLGRSDGVLRMGASIGHVDGSAGSIGFFASRRSDGRTGVVSCNHVIAMADRGRDGDAVVSPSSIDGGTRIVASLDGSYPRLTGGATVDSAFAALHEDVEYDAGGLDPSVADATPDLEVSKIGRLTNERPGVVLKVEVDDVYVDLGLRQLVFHDVIVIGAASRQAFAVHGDSGALVFTTGTRQPVGLLFAASILGGPHNLGQAWIHPLQRVTAALSVDIVSHRGRRR